VSVTSGFVTLKRFEPLFREFAAKPEFGYPYGGPRSPAAQGGGVVSRACDASFRPSRRREARSS
jgi:hypothetical protein